MPTVMLTRLTDASVEPNLPIDSKECRQVLHPTHREVEGREGVRHLEYALHCETVEDGELEGMRCVFSEREPRNRGQ